MKPRLVSHDVVGPGLVGGVVAGDPPNSTGAQHSCDQWDLGGVNKATLRVPGLRPGIGEKEIQAVQACAGESSQQSASVIIPEAEIWGQGGGRLIQRLRDKAGEQGAEAVLEDLAGDKCGIGLGLHLGERVFAAAEADLEGKLPRVRRERSMGACGGF